MACAHDSDLCGPAEYILPGKIYPQMPLSYPGPGCSKSDQDNPALLASSCKFLAGKVSCLYCLPFSCVPK